MALAFALRLLRSTHSRHDLLYNNKLIGVNSKAASRKELARIESHIDLTRRRASYVVRYELFVKELEQGTRWNGSHKAG